MKIKGFIIFTLVFFFSIFFLNSVFAEEKMDSAGIIPKLPKTADDPELFNGHVYPFWGPPCQRYTYSVIYRDKEGRPPEYVKIYFNGQMIDMTKSNPEDNDYRKGVLYEYKYVPHKLGSNFYYFEASNGKGKARDSIIDSPDNGPVLFESAFDKNEIAVIDRATGQKILSFPTKNEWVGGVAISDDGNYLAAKTSKHIYFFDLTKSKEPLWQFACETCRIGDDVKGGVAISGDGTKIVAAIGENVILFDKSANKPVWKYQAGNAYNVAISKDGNYLAAATAGEESNVNSNLLIFWSKESSKPLWQYHALGNFHDVSLSDDGSFIAGATGCPDRKAYLFSKDSNTPLIQSDRLTRDSPVHRAKISANGVYFAVGSEADAGAVFLFSKEKKEPLWKFPTPNGSSVRALNFTPSGEYIGAATFSGNAYIFSKDSNQPIRSWKVNASLGGLDIADDGSFIAAGGTDNKVHLFEKDKDESKEVSFNEYVEEIDISGNGRYIAAGTGGSIYFFESFTKDEDKIFSCTTIIEPTPESEIRRNFWGEEKFPPEKIKQDRPLGAFFGAGFLVSLLTLIVYLGVIKFNLLQRPAEKQLKLNRKIIALFSALIVIFLALTTWAVIFNREQSPRLDKENRPATNGKYQQDQKSKCGNSLCEPDLGESQENCPKDCSGED